MVGQAGVSCLTWLRGECNELRQQGARREGEGSLG